MENGLSASDVALLNGDGMGGMNGMIWLFAILALMGGGFNWGGNKTPGLGYENYATSAEVQRGFEAQNNMAMSRDILGAVTNGTTVSVSAVKDAQNYLSSQIAQVGQMEQSILGNQNECCGSTKMMIAETGGKLSSQIDQAKYETAMQLAQMEARFNAKIDQGENARLRERVNQLELAQATAGVLRFPNTWSYGAGPFPPIYGNCPCQQGA